MDSTAWTSSPATPTRASLAGAAGPYSVRITGLTLQSGRQQRWVSVEQALVTEGEAVDQYAGYLFGWPAP